MNSRLIRVTTSWYCAAMIEKGGFIVEAAPILKRNIGRLAKDSVNFLKDKHKAQIEIYEDKE